MEQTPFKILQVLVGAILGLRYDVLRPGRPQQEANFNGDNEPTTFHFAAITPDENGSVISCVSYMLAYCKEHNPTQPAYQLRGMATNPDFRGQHIGAKLIAEAEKQIVEKTGIKTFWCKARKESMGFYQKQGWIIISDEFDIPTVGPHVIMLCSY